MQMRAPWAVALMLLGFVACASEEDDTRIAVRNAGTASIDATVSDGVAELRFDGVAAGTTSTFQSVPFGSLSGLKVSVGGVNSTVSLTEGKGNVVDVAADGKVSGVSIPVSTGNEGGGGW